MCSSFAGIQIKLHIEETKQNRSNYTQTTFAHVFIFKEKKTHGNTCIKMLVMTFDLLLNFLFVYTKQKIKKFKITISITFVYFFSFNSK